MAARRVSTRPWSPSVVLATASGGPRGPPGAAARRKPRRQHIKQMTIQKDSTNSLRNSPAKSTTLTDDSIALSEVLEKSADADLLREMIGFAAERLMEPDVQALTSAGCGRRAPGRSTWTSLGSGRPAISGLPGSCRGCGRVRVVGRRLARTLPQLRLGTGRAAGNTPLGQCPTHSSPIDCPVSPAPLLAGR
jgi:hypothetical protein